MANDELYTPKHIFEALAIEFDLDVCAPLSGPLHVPAKKWYSESENGLSQAWEGTVWMNPPFSLPRPWVEKWIQHSDGIALLPLSGNSRWWHNIWQSAAVGLMLAPNTSFTNPEGKTQKIMYGTSLWALGEKSIKALRDSGLGHVR